MRTYVTFRSDAFNTTKTKDDYFNPGNFGDDVAHWLRDQMTARGVQLDPEVEQEDHGWFFTFTPQQTNHDLVVGWRDGDWVCWVEKAAGLVASLFGARKKGVEPSAVELVDEILKSSGQIRDIRWHHAKDFLSGKEEGAPSPPHS